MNAADSGKNRPASAILLTFAAARRSLGDVEGLVCGMPAPQQSFKQTAPSW